jgi:hypothetical protein
VSPEWGLKQFADIAQKLEKAIEFAESQATHQAQGDSDRS